MKKKQHNGNRSKTPDPTAESEQKKEPKETDDTEELKESEKTEKAEELKGTEKTEKTEANAEHAGSDSEGTEELEFDEEMVEQVRVQTSLIEEREVSREETIEMLRRVMRQRSMAEEKRRDYVVRFLKEKEENPP